ncbi:pyridoxamine 5'-phosphate oxidase [Brachybacterium squillarum]|uniref:pyridoxamine 5'-phosphate oxidase n=1 Tax=Brachybacterium squillarum TaxID=661979 RepID=UPI000262972C|nr:pyridoxamine 5'-phosphate oxidase [Brachybacterium squillarum]
MTSPADPIRPSSVPDPLAGERVDYRAGHLDDSAPSEPFPLFAAWMQEALDRRDTRDDLVEPSAVVLSTVHLAEDGTPRPRSRTVLLKGSGPEGLLVYTNRGSAKGQELAATPWASLLLPWYALQRQVRIEGRAELLDDASSDAYFASRPRGSQLGAWASQQSAPVASREELERAFTVVEERFEDGEVPRPPFWGGYRIVPERFEFWQGRGDRLHDRLVYTRTAEGAWRRERLQP